LDSDQINDDIDQQIDQQIGQQIDEQSIPIKMVWKNIKSNASISNMVKLS